MSEGMNMAEMNRSLVRVPDSRVQWEAICPQTLLAALTSSGARSLFPLGRRPQPSQTAQERGVLDFLVTPQNSELRSG